MKSVLIVDYGIGNLLSVARAFERRGAAVSVSGDPGRLRHAERVVLPGVGAFGDCVKTLHEHHLFEPAREFALSGRPFLGICVGMQMLFDESAEFGRHGGLGLIAGRVEAIPTACPDGGTRKVPHIGWNALLKPEPDTSWERSILAGVAEGEAVYFVHSFAGHPADPDHRLAECDYLGERLCAAVKAGNTYGCQFHPEKSGPTGLRIIDGFLAC